MPARARLGDPCGGHGCFSPRPNIQGSPNVFTDGLPVHRKTDAWSVHCCGIPCHGSTLAQGSPTVFSNGLPNGRVGDPVACGSSVAAGSPTTFDD